MIRERERSAVSGLLMLLVLLALIAGATYGANRELSEARAATGVGVAWLLVDLLAASLLAGLFMVNPNEGRVLQLFGDYRGTVKQPGLRWANPFYTKKRISQRVRNFETGHLKVNDTDGNPVEIAAVVVWKVVDTAEASFEVDNYEHYVHVQSEAALRNLATRYPYDAHEEAQVSLRGNTAAVARDLKGEIQDRLAKAGVEVIEARISHLAYAPEIAAAMLRRQQAGAIVAARARIVEGAVGMVEMALAHLARSTQVQFDEERKAAMVSNLLVVLCADREVQPVVNTGTIYQ
jgi:regulator of protease activity HflC (stomatin/prohibitin superfamily)